MAILEKLIIESPRVVTYESLYLTYYDTRYFDSEPDIQVLRNVISALKKYVRITNVSKSGYKIELPKRIKRFGSIRKCDVSDISELFLLPKAVLRKRTAKRLPFQAQKSLSFPKSSSIRARRSCSAKTAKPL